MKILVIRAAVLAIALCMQCQKQHGQKTADISAAAPSHRPALFLPPPDSAISPYRMHAWFACHAGLDSISSLFADSFSTGDQGLLERRQRSFLDAQDRICMKNGLKSGYREYCWITDNIGAARNRAVFDSERKIVEARGK